MRVLLVEDNEKLSGLIEASMNKAGFSVESAYGGEEALGALAASGFGLIILDLGLPDIDGMEVLRQLRAAKNPVPVLILTARDNIDEKITGLNAGADDYLTKPFEMRELVARAHALFRRPAHDHQLKLEVGNIVFDPVHRQAEISGKGIRLSKRETSLLEILMRSSGKTVTKDTLEIQLYGFEEDGSANSIEVLVHRLRKKLLAESAEIEIHTLRGIGYMMADKN